VARLKNRNGKAIDMFRKAALAAAFLAAIFSAAVCVRAAANSYKGWHTFKGAWFEIKYPPDFKAKSSLPGTTSSEGCDSAFFVSPDGAVEFYVFSPQWNGDPSDVVLDPETEEIEAQKTENRKDGTTVKRYTIAAKNGSYSRSYIDTQNVSMNTRTVFGIKYSSRKFYDKYKSRYLVFKDSLVQFAD
jgi:hypothetical protein